LGDCYLTVRCPLPNLNLHLRIRNLINGLEKTKLVVADPDGRAI